MTDTLLATLRAHYGTVSHRTETSGVVAVRNKTAFKQLALLVQGVATVKGLYADLYPRLVRVTEVTVTGSPWTVDGSK